MAWLKRRFQYIFGSTKGLILFVSALIALETAFMGMLSGPMAEWGIRDFWIRLWGMKLEPAHREARIIFLYHTFAIGVIALETYMITGLVKMKEWHKAGINAVMTVGYLMVLIFGLGFAYWGENWAFHGLFLFGLSLVFFAGMWLAYALWPWAKEYRLPEGSPYWRLPGGIDGERLAFFVMAVATLISAVYGAVPGSYFGNGFEVFLSEDMIRIPEHSALELAIVGHLHIMLVDIAVAAMLIVFRWVDFKGRLHPWATFMTIIGTIIISVGAWMVVPFRDIAHKVINVGAMFLMLASLLLTIYTWRKQIEVGLRKMGVQGKATLGQRLKALLMDPLPVGATWQMMYMNVVVTAPGVFMAIKLDMLRDWLLREERIGLVGHWHVLSAIIATILLLHYADVVGLKGKIRKWYGWTMVVASDIAFAAATLFYTKRIYVTESQQQPLVNAVMWTLDIALFLVLVIVAALFVWRLVDLFKPEGKWTEEWHDPTFKPIFTEEEAR